MFIRNGNFLSGKQKWHPSTCSSAEVPWCELCLCNHMQPTFRLVPGPRTFRGSQGRKGNVQWKMTIKWSFSDFVNLYKQFLLLIFKPLHPGTEMYYLLSHFQKPLREMREKGRGEGRKKWESLSVCVCESAKAGSLTELLQTTSWEGGQ